MTPGAAGRQPLLRRAVALLCGTVAGSALLAIMLLTLVDVAGRKFFSTSLPGALELTELLMVAVIFAGLPLVALAGEHVTFDSLDGWLPPRLRRAQQAGVDLVCSALLAGLAGLMWHKAGQMAGYGDTTAQLQLPLGPFVQAMAVLIGISALAHLLLLLAPVAHHHAGVSDDPPASGGRL